MKKITALLLMLLPFLQPSYSQDTNVVQFPDGCKSYWILNKPDTVLISIYPNGKKESKRFFKNGDMNGKYFRWYENGKLMWIKEMANNVPEGNAVFYNTKGIKVAELNFHTGKVKDTLYIREGIHLVLGNISYHSKIIGGMLKEDGSSNISERSGPYQHLTMYAAKTDSLQKPTLIQYFKSDDYGDFFILSPKGRINFFPKTIPLKNLPAGTSFPPDDLSNSTLSGWNTKTPVTINNERLIFVQLHHTSKGYAP